MIHLIFNECSPNACHGVQCFKLEEDGMKNTCSCFCYVYNPVKQAYRKSDAKFGNKTNLPWSQFSSLLFTDAFVLLVEVSLGPLSKFEDVYRRIQSKSYFYLLLL